jgi:hypothetical protein
MPRPVGFGRARPIGEETATKIIGEKLIMTKLEELK